VKHEWRKKEKAVYFPKNEPQLIDIPKYQFLSIRGTGNPNSAFFGDYITALYSMAYAIKMTLKKQEPKPKKYVDWTVYPLEGVWDISDKAKENFDGTIDKNELVFNLMLRQPDFVTQDFFNEMLVLVKKKKPQPLLEKVRFEKITEGSCIQMMHLGSYDNEPATFDIMETYTKRIHRVRTSKVHREIYLSDFRKVRKEKLKTVLRFRCHKE